MIEPPHDRLSIARQWELIGLNRTSCYRSTAGATETAENLELMRLIDEEYTRHPFYGSRKRRDYLCRIGHVINRKRVRRLMQKMGLQSLAPTPYTSKPNVQHTGYPYLLHGLEIDRPNQVWCTDIP